ncbi:hypothetical protein ACLB2K_063827 [Fragaria x ananassa]
MNQWCFSRQASELHSPSRRYGISLSIESQLCSQYCSYLRQLGSKLRLPHLTIVKATMFCHCFYPRQSTKNDCHTVSTACIFLASKVEDSLRFRKDVVNVAFSNEIQDHIVNQMYKPQYIAAGSVAVAASILKLILPATDKWLEGLDVSPKELNEVIQRIQSKLCRVKTKEVIGSVSSC